MRTIVKFSLAADMVMNVLQSPVRAQDPLDAVDLNSPEMSQAEMSRQDVENILKAASAGAPADFTVKHLSGLDL